MNLKKCKVKKFAVGASMPLAVLVLFLFAGCVAAKVTPAGQRVKIIENKPVGCKDLGQVYGSASTGVGYWNSEYARNQIRNRAASRGANIIALDSTTNTNERIALTGEAYRCPE